MRVDDDFFAEFAAALDDRGERVGPGVIGQDFHRHDGRAFGREAQPPHVRNREQRITDEGQHLGRELVRVAARDHDVLELGPRRDIVEGVLPVFGRLGEPRFVVDFFGVGSDRV